MQEKSQLEAVYLLLLFILCKAINSVATLKVIVISRMKYKKVQFCVRFVTFKRTKGYLTTPFSFLSH